MRRFTDPVLFGILFLVTTIVWWVAAVTHNVPDTPEGQLAPMTVIVFCIIATPAFAVATLMALFRAVFNVNPKPFWAWVTGASAVTAVLVYLAKLVTDLQSVQVGFSTTTWFAAALTTCALIGLVLAATGALPWDTPEVRAQKAKERAQQKAAEKAERKAEKKEEARQRKADKQAAQQAQASVTPAPAATQVHETAPVVDTPEPSEQTWEVGETSASSSPQTSSDLDAETDLDAPGTPTPK